MTHFRKITPDTLIRLGLCACLLVILNRTLLAWVFKGYSVYLGYIFLGFCFYVLVTSMLLNYKSIKLNSLDRFVLAYSVFILLRALTGEELFRSIIGLALYGGTIPAYWIMRFTKVGSDKLVKLLFWCFVYLVAFASVEIVLSVPLGPVHWYYSRLSFFPHRLSSTLGSSNHFSIILPAISVFLTAYLLNKPRRRAIHIITLNSITLFFVLGTSSRGGILTYIVSLTLLLLFLQRAYEPKKFCLHHVLAVVGAFILFFMAFTLFEAEEEQLRSLIKSSVDTSEWNNAVRLQKYGLIIDIVTNDWKTSLVGTGLGHAGNIIHRAGLPTIFQLHGFDEFHTTESSALKLLLETGVVGLLFFYFLLFKSIHLCQRYGPQSTFFQHREVFLGISGVLMLIALRSLILQVFDVPAVLLFTWGGMGYLSGVISKKVPVDKLEKRTWVLQDEVCK